MPMLATQEMVRRITEQQYTHRKEPPRGLLSMCLGPWPDLECALTFTLQSMSDDRKQAAGPSGSSVEGVDAYIAAVHEPARSTLEKTRSAIRAAAPQAEETISYQMPTFKYRGKFLLSYAAFKDHCSLFPMSGSFFSDHLAELKAVSANFTGKGTLQFPLDRPLPATVLKKIVKMRINEIDRGLDSLRN